jgi:hypothetical protein
MRRVCRFGRARKFNIAPRFVATQIQSTFTGICKKCRDDPVQYELKDAPCPTSRRCHRGNLVRFAREHLDRLAQWSSSRLSAASQLARFAEGLSSAAHSVEVAPSPSAVGLSAQLSPWPLHLHARRDTIAPARPAVSLVGHNSPPP